MNVYAHVTLDDKRRRWTSSVGSSRRARNDVRCCHPLLSTSPRRDQAAPSVGARKRKTAGQRGGCLRLCLARL